MWCSLPPGHAQALQAARKCTAHCLHGALSLRPFHFPVWGGRNGDSLLHGRTGVFHTILHPHTGSALVMGAGDIAPSSPKSGCCVARGQQQQAAAPLGCQGCTAIQGCREGRRLLQPMTSTHECQQLQRRGHRRLPLTEAGSPGTTRWGKGPPPVQRTWQRQGHLPQRKSGQGFYSWKGNKVVG